MIDIPVRNSDDTMLQPPEIKINLRYNPFDGDESTTNKPELIDRLEKRNSANWKSFTAHSKRKTKTRNLWKKSPRAREDSFR